MRKFRFWLSRLIEKIFRWSSAQKMGEEIIKNVKERNNRYWDQCKHCGQKGLTEQRSGSEGLFTWPHIFYQCPHCGNTQEHRRAYGYEYEFKALKEKRIVRDGSGQYRYAIFKDWQWAMIIMILIFGVAVGVGIILT